MGRLGPSQSHFSSTHRTRWRQPRPPGSSSRSSRGGAGVGSLLGPNFLRVGETGTGVREMRDAMFKDSSIVLV